MTQYHLDGDHLDDILRMLQANDACLAMAICDIIACLDDFFVMIPDDSVKLPESVTRVFAHREKLRSLAVTLCQGLQADA